MARRARKSPTLNAAKDREERIARFDPNLVVADNLSLVSYKTAIDALGATLAEYNGTLAKADVLLNKITKAEDDLRDQSERVLTAVASKYGKDSSEYEQAGAVRKSERKKPVKKA